MSFEHSPKPSHVDTSFRPGGMVGMLDYRASKLYRLLVFPIRIAARLVEVTIIAICVLATGQWSTSLVNRAAEAGTIYGANVYNLSIVLHIIIAAVVTAVAMTILSILWGLVVLWPFNKIFLFFVDVVPSEGRSYPQALAVLQRGDIARLVLRMESPETWTDSDTYEYVKRLPLIVKLVCGDRIKRRMPEMIAILDNAKRDGVNLSTDTFELKRRLKPINDTVGKQERLVTNWIIRSAAWLVAVFIICLFIYYK
jgi:hypothetical protein